MVGSRDLLGFCALLLAAPAAAQVGTTCYRNGAWVNCTSSERRPVDQAKVLREGEAMVPIPAPADPAADLRRRVGTLVVAHRCDEAINLALKAGEMELAAQAKDICRP